MKTLFLLLLLSFNLYSFERSPFINSQVDFWKMIYTDVSQGQTVLHDRLVPEIVYQVIDHHDSNHHQRLKKVNIEVKKLRAALKKISSKKMKRLSAYEKGVLEKIPKKYRNNFWKRIKAVRYQQGMKEKFKLGVEKSGLYFSYIKKALKKYRVPEDLAYLPHVESSFNYNAYSRVGAAGIWQFMRPSARLYKLKIGDVVDERLDPIKASYAAAYMLKDNYRILKSWPLAIVAYNHGPNGLKKAVRKLGTKNFTKIIHNYKHRNFSFASQNFYASFLAAVEVAKKFESQMKVSSTLTFKKEILKKSVRAKDLLAKYGMSIKDFRFYNPMIKKSAIKRNKTISKGVEIRLPMEQLALK
jgi:membrane-bound lytic murein transglycosylase D